MSAINQRIIDLIRALELSNSAFASSINFNKGSLQNIVGPRRSTPGADVTEKILKTFPEVRSEWLMTGAGEMFHDPFINTAIIAAALLAEGNPRYQVKQMGTGNVVGHGNRQTITITQAECEQQLAYWKERAATLAGVVTDKQTIIDLLLQGKK